MDETEMQAPKRMNRTPEQWAKVNPDAVVAGSAAQARNVLEMALHDIGTLSRMLCDSTDEIERLRAALAENDPGPGDGAIFDGDEIGSTKNSRVRAVCFS